jgi:hypothetical protein
MKQRTKILVVGLMLVVLCLLSFFVFAHAVPVGKLSRVAAGMTKAQVEGIIGAPQHIRHENTGSTAFCYGGVQQLRWCSAEIYFGVDGRFSGSVFHDH